MRVIAGKCKGRTLKTLKGYHTRPTLGRVKEAIFNVLSKEIKNASFLDLFSGTGSIGIEAFSRGAKPVCFVENNSSALKVLKENLKICNLSEQGNVLALNIDYALEFLKKNNKQFQIIFMDPPYSYGFLDNTISEIIKKGLLLSNGILIVETDKATILPLNYNDLRQVKECIYGDTKITYYQYD